METHFLAGRKLRDDEEKVSWADYEKTYSAHARFRVSIGTKLEREGFGLLGDYTEENSIDDQFCVVTPQDRLHTNFMHSKE